jgi:hypothetical protein
MSTIHSLEHLIDLQEVTVKQKFLQRLKGKFVGNFFIPNVSTATLRYLWYYYGRIGGMTPQVSENEIGQEITQEFEHRSSRVYFYRENAGISEYSLRAGTLITTLVDKVVDLLSSRAALRIEYEKLKAILNGGFNYDAFNNVYYTDLSTGNRQWIGGTGAVDSQTDMTNAKSRLFTYAFVEPDTMLINPAVYAYLVKTYARWDRHGPISQSVITDGTIPNGRPQDQADKGSVGRLFGLEVFVSNLMAYGTQSDYSKKHDDRVKKRLAPIVGNNVYIFKRGPDLAEAHFFNQVNVISEPIRRAHKTVYQIDFAFNVNIYRPQLIYTIKNVVA